MDNQPTFDGFPIVQDYNMRITVHPQPLIARNTSGRRNYFMPMCETEWIQMVNKLDRGQSTQSSARGSAYVKSRANFVRSVSANSYFDPYSLRANASNYAPHAQQPANPMSRPQMQRAYERVCSQTSTGKHRVRALSISSKSERLSDDRDDHPLLVTRSAPLISRSTVAAINQSGCSYSRKSAMGDIPEKETPSTPAFLNQKSQKTAGNLPSRREAWYSTPFRSRIIKQSPPWRSLMNRRPQGLRASGDLCPNHCRCCFEASYDTNRKNTYRIDLK